MKRAVTPIIISLFAAVVLPLQTYLANTSAYAYGFGRLLAEQSLVAVVLALLLWGAMRAADRWLRGMVTPLLVALMVALYLAAGPLAQGLPEINGEMPASLDNMARKLWDGGVWIGIFSVTFGLRRFVSKNGVWIAAVVLAMGIASLFDVKPDEATTLEARSGGYELSADIIDNVEYSPTRNVLMFVLDNVDAHVAADIVSADSNLAKKFSGFVAYRNNIGMHDSTKLGVPGMMTGKFFIPGRGQLAKYILSVYGEDSALWDFTRRGDSVYAMFCTCSYGFTTAKIPPERRRVKAETKGMAICCRTAEVPYLSLADAVMFRTLPFVFKRQFLSTKLRQREVIWNVDQQYDYENTVFPILASRPIANEAREMFLKVHTHGAHGPYLAGIADYREATSNALVRLSELFDSYRANGVYDHSFIAVVADHGCGAYVEAAGEPPKLRALLWTKADGDTAPFSAVEEPTSHARFAALLKKAAAGEVSRDDARAILRDDHRFYRQRDPNDRHGCIDWDVDDKGKAKLRKK